MAPSDRPFETAMAMGRFRFAQWGQDLVYAAPAQRPARRRGSSSIGSYRHRPFELLDGEAGPKTANVCQPAIAVKDKPETMEEFAGSAQQYGSQPPYERQRRS